MKIKDMPFYNRPAILLRKKGAKSVSDDQLLAIILGHGDKNENAIEQANRILNKYNFHRLSDLSIEELENEFNFRKNVKAVKIYAMFEIFRRTKKLEKKGYDRKIKTAEDVFHYFVDEYKDKKQEYFIALLLNTKNQIIRDEVISLGTLNASLIHPREVFRSAIRAGSNAIILVHNHPSGGCKPSFEDKEVTKILLKAGEVLQIKVLDHVIIGKDNFFSLKEKGIIT
jgi:DNA repair protein RadC